MELKTGSDESTLDEKGRVSIPIRFREQYQGKLIITRGLDRCAWIMTPEKWEELKQGMFGASDLTFEERIMLEEKHTVEEAEIDKSGRIAIPTAIRTYAKLTRDCSVICTAQRISIWDRAMFDEYLTERDAVARAAMNKIGTGNGARAN